VSELVAERLDLLLSSLQTDAHHHRHVLVMNQKHHGDISLESKSFEPVLLALRQKGVDGVLQLIVMGAVVGGDCLPCSINYYISI
jgi:hypothetical protein